MGQEIIVRACGHEAVFVPSGDRFDDARRDKLRRKRCHDCALLNHEEANRKNHEDNLRRNAERVAQPNNGKRVKKGSEAKLLPVGAVVSLVLEADGWHGTLSAAGERVEATVKGAMGILAKLARKWLVTQGTKITGKP